MNFIHIAGHLGADPEVRFTSTGKKVTTLRIATRTRKGKTDDTIWYKATIWGEEFDTRITFLKKGSAAMIHGVLQKPEIFTDREGKPQISLEIKVTELEFSPFGKPGGNTSKEGTPNPGFAKEEGMPVNPYMNVTKGKDEGTTFDDEVPF